MMRSATAAAASAAACRATAASLSSSSSSRSWVRSPTLQAALPALRAQFQKQCQDNNDGLFPILTPRQLERAHKLVAASGAASSQRRRRQAAVLVPICSVVFDDGNDHEEPSLLFTVRSSRVTTHKSEISFPGGHLQEDVDGTDLVKTALRETREELLLKNDFTTTTTKQQQLPSRDCNNDDEDDGYPWSEVEILGACEAIPSLNGTPVTAVIAVLPHVLLAHDTFRGHPDEVDAVFFKSIEDLKREESWHDIGRLTSPAPYYPTEEHGNIWGLTAFLLRPILHRLLVPVFGNSNNNKKKSRQQQELHSTAR